MSSSTCARQCEHQHNSSDDTAARDVARSAADQGLTLMIVGHDRWKLLDIPARTVVIDGARGNGVPLATVAALLRTQSRSRADPT